MRESHLHCGTIGEIRRQAELEQCSLKTRHRIALKYQESFFNQPDVEAQELFDRAEAVIGADVHRCVPIHRIEQLPKRRIDGAPVFVNAVYVGVVLLGIEEWMIVVQQMPQLMLKS